MRRIRTCDVAKSIVLNMHVYIDILTSYLHNYSFQGKRLEEKLEFEEKLYDAKYLNKIFYPVCILILFDSFNVCTGCKNSEIFENWCISYLISINRSYRRSHHQFGI